MHEPRRAPLLPARLVLQRHVVLPRRGELPLQARERRLRAAEALIDAGANVNDTLSDGTSALVLAILSAQYEMGRFLVEHGANPNAAEQGWTALHQLAWTRRPRRGPTTVGPVARGAVSGAACGFAVSFCAVPVDVVKINAFVADEDPEALGIYCGLLKEYLTTHAGREAVAHTYVTVSALALPGVLIEIEGVAIRET